MSQKGSDDFLEVGVWGDAAEGGIGKNTQGEAYPWDYLELRFHGGWSIGVPYVVMLCNLNTKVCACALMYTLRHIVIVYKNSHFIPCVASNYKCSEFLFLIVGPFLFLSEFLSWCLQQGLGKLHV